MGWSPGLNSIRPGSTPEAPIGLLKKTNTSGGSSSSISFACSGGESTNGLILSTSATERHRHSRGRHTAFFVPSCLPSAASMENFCASSISSPIDRHPISSTPTGTRPTKAFTIRCATHFLHSRAAVGLACVQAAALRTHVAPLTVPHQPLPRVLYQYDPPPPSLPSSSTA